MTDWPNIKRKTNFNKEEVVILNYPEIKKDEH